MDRVVFLIYIYFKKYITIIFKKNSKMHGCMLNTAFVLSIFKKLFVFAVAAVFLCKRR